MKKRFFPAMLLAATLGVVGCADKDLDEIANSTENSGKYAYLNTAISLPSSSFTRSSTDDPDDPNGNGGNTNSDATPDFEYGHDYESEVRSMILVVADKDDNYITHTLVPSITQTPEDNKSFDFTVNSKIPYDVLEQAYGAGGLLESDKSINVYVYCNYTADILDKFEKYAKELEASDEADKTAWLDWTGEVEESPAAAGQAKPAITNTIWAKRSFLMTNAAKYTSTFPATLDEWEKHANKDTPYDLSENKGALPVERVAARFDFKDASENGDLIYPLWTLVGKKDKEGGDDGEKEDDIQNLFSVKLTRMALVNMSNEFYLLRRVSKDGQKDDWEIGGKEVPSNFVVDVDAADKIEEEGINPGNADEHFNFCLFEKSDMAPYKYNKNGWYADNILDVLGEGNLNTTPDNDNWKNKEYKIWRYVTENTIPANITGEGDEETVDVSQQKTVQSTGIVFKGAIIAGENLSSTNRVSEAVRKALNVAAGKDANVNKETYTYPILYSYNNVLYAGIGELIAAAADDGQGGPLYNAVDKMLQYWKLEGNSYTRQTAPVTDAKTVLTTSRCDSIMKGLLSNYTVDFISANGIVDQADQTYGFMVSAPQNAITVYEATDEEDGAGRGYYCYYFYWNRHNDNGKSGKMGPMEFATVRNNVYKLSVKAINQLGHPRDTSHDPDPVDPEDPDEDPTNYIKVDVEVLPWVVRENEITF